MPLPSRGHSLDTPLGQRVEVALVARRANIDRDTQTNVMPLPTFFIIGAPKCGTTSLHAYLDQHPEIGMSLRKETHFFVGPENIPQSVKRIDSLATYETLFDSTYEVRGEASPSYSAHPMHVGAPARIRTLIPNAKFIYLVRDPIDRTISHYMQRVAMEGERRSLQEALGDLSDASSPYTCPSHYASQLDHYLRWFPQNRMLVIDQTDLLTDRRATLREIFSFLMVDDTYYSPRFDDALGTARERRTYWPAYVRFAERIGASPLRLLPRGARRSLRRSVDRALWPPLETPPLDPDLRSRLEELYAGDAQRFRALTKKALPTWTV